MGKILSTILLITFLLVLPAHVKADKVAGGSALLSYNYSSSTLFDVKLKKMVIKRVLERYKSPLAGAVDEFVQTCTTYDLDCYLIPSIAGIESQFGNIMVPDTNNPFGWGKGYIYFDSWQSAIHTVGYSLRHYYFDKGAVSLDDVGIIYAQTTTWAPKVRYFMNVFKAEEEKMQLFLSQNQVE